MPAARTAAGPSSSSSSSSSSPRSAPEGSASVDARGKTIQRNRRDGRDARFAGTPVREDHGDQGEKTDDPALDEIRCLAALVGAADECELRRSQLGGRCVEGELAEFERVAPLAGCRPDAADTSFRRAVASAAFSFFDLSSSTAIDRRVTVPGVTFDLLDDFADREIRLRVFLHVVGCSRRDVGGCAVGRGAGRSSCTRDSRVGRPVRPEEARWRAVPLLPAVYVSLVTFSAIAVRLSGSANVSVIVDFLAVVEFGFDPHNGVPVAGDFLHHLLAARGPVHLRRRSSAPCGCS